MGVTGESWRTGERGKEWDEVGVTEDKLNGSGDDTVPEVYSERIRTV